MYLRSVGSDVFTCLILCSPGDELFSDSYKITVVHDILYEVEGKVRNLVNYCRLGKETHVILTTIGALPKKIIVFARQGNGL